MPVFKFQAVLSNPAVFITQRSETGRPIPIQMQKMVNYYAIRSIGIGSYLHFDILSPS
jgi:hypothetical protein